jgi:hypothetical protein
MGWRKKGVGVINRWIEHILVPYKKGKRIFAYSYENSNRNRSRMGAARFTKNGCNPTSQSGASLLFVWSQC